MHLPAYPVRGCVLQVPLTTETEYGQLVRAMQVQCGAMHTIVLVQNHGRLEVRSAGGSSYGQLGLGSRDECHRFKSIPALQVGFHHMEYSCCILPK